MRFTLTDVLNAAERLVRGGRNDALEAAQKRAMQEDSITNLVRDAATETVSSIIRRIFRRR